MKIFASQEMPYLGIDDIAGFGKLKENRRHKYYYTLDNLPLTTNIQETIQKKSPGKRYSSIVKTTYKILFLLALTPIIITDLYLFFSRVTIGNIRVFFHNKNIKNKFPKKALITCYLALSAFLFYKFYFYNAS
jgi:hypothetical protein